MIYKITLNINKNKKFKLFKNKNKKEKDYNISMNLEYIIPFKDVISINYNKNDENIILLYQKEKNNFIKKKSVMSLLKYNYYSSFYSYCYFKKDKANININFCSKFILNEFLDYYTKLKYTILKLGN